jgi:hypothetical protein
MGMHGRSTTELHHVGLCNSCSDCERQSLDFRNQEVARSRKKSTRGYASKFGSFGSKVSEITSSLYLSFPLAGLLLHITRVKICRSIRSFGHEPC